MMQSTYLEKSVVVSPTGQKQTDQVVLESHFKTIEVILQSRVHFPPPSTPRRARFNFDMQEIARVRESMAIYKENIHLPVILDIKMNSILLERWHLTYINGVQAQTPMAGEFMAQLRKVAQQIAILLRALFCLVRILPAFPVSQQLKCQQEDLGHPLVGLEYDIGSNESQMPSQFDVGATIQQYSFMPIDTPFGMLKLSVMYRKQNADVLTLIQQMTPPSPSALGKEIQEIEVTLEHAIITDYVPKTPQMTAISSPISTPKTRTVVQEDVEIEDGAFAQEVYHPTSQPMPIPHLPRTDTKASYNRRESSPTTPPVKQAHSYEAPENLRQQRPPQPSPITAPYGYTKQPSALEVMTKANSYQTPPRHPNSAPGVVNTVRPPLMAPLDGFVLDGKTSSFRPESADSDKSATQLPFTLNEPKKRQNTPPFFSSSPPFHALASEPPSASPSNVPATRIHFHPNRDGKERRRSDSFDVNSSAWGIAPSELSLSPLLVHDNGDETSLPFALTSSTKVEVGSFLQQLKQAPPLHVASSGHELASVDQELAYFRQLRDEMTREP
ncbi:hypothetical protein THRCLA_00432 [Thraustotheca clavata]|uniref:Autophagy-related protein 13 N-terminal domain-containing protein n=1 Tax=Thraustotheca clavata TaxID=74557 RepID=A0A1W0AC18_9STRA|nr:hypothetical protein THRCLA_00432 [Thraustotheca clavata]